MPDPNKTETAFVKPTREGLVIRDPETTVPLPAGGATVRLNRFWRNRISDGDLEIVPKSGQDAPKKAQQKKAED
ncbi:MAG: DUF2635 domain-containing protein [Magnetovibrionaceae bacterium]